MIYYLIEAKIATKNIYLVTIKMFRLTEYIYRYINSTVYFLVHIP